MTQPKKVGRLIIFSAPSGSGKSTIIKALMDRGLNLRFSVSATSRPPRGQEVNGRDYYFLSPEDFRRHIDNGDFLEYQEVYKDRYYGTLKSEVDRRLECGENVVCDVDVLGAGNIKKIYDGRALSLFIQPPSIDALRERLKHRATDSPAIIEDRIARAAFELTFADKADVVIVNDDLATAIDSAYSHIVSFIES